MMRRPGVGVPLAGWCSEGKGVGTPPRSGRRPANSSPKVSSMREFLTDTDRSTPAMLIPSSRHTYVVRWAECQ